MTETPQTHDLLTVEEVALILRANERQVRQWAYQAVLPGIVRVGRSFLRFRREAIERLAGGDTYPEKPRESGS